MSIYRYADSSTVREAAFHHANDRPPVALLAANEKATAGELAAITHALEAAGWQAVPAFASDRPVLQVSGFKKEAELTDFLNFHGFAQGQPAVAGEPGDNPKSGFREKISRQSLKLNGAFNLIGNAGLVADGIRQRDPYRLAGAGLLTVSALNLARYGSAKSEHYTREVATELADFVRQQEGSLPADSGLANVEAHKHKGIIGRSEHFLYHYPAQVTLTVSSGGATAMMISGIQRARRDSKEWGALGFGVSSLALKLASLLIPEKSKDDKQNSTAEKRSAFTKAADWVREKPLRIYGFGSLITDAFLGFDAYQQFKKGGGSKGYLYTAAAAVSYTLADIMMAISSKNHVNTDGKFDADEQRGIVALAAEAVSNQAEAARSQMAQRIGSFLVTRKEMKGDAGSISEDIIQQARHMAENPWVRRIETENPGTPVR